MTFVRQTAEDLAAGQAKTIDGSKRVDPPVNPILTGAGDDYAQPAAPTPEEKRHPITGELLA